MKNVKFVRFLNCYLYLFYNDKIKNFVSNKPERKKMI